MNPSVTVITATTTPQLVFSGMGKVRVRSVNGNAKFGDANLNASDSKTWLQTGSAFEFSAPAEIYAATASGTDPVSVEVWF